MRILSFPITFSLSLTPPGISGRKDLAASGKSHFRFAGVGTAASAVRAEPKLRSLPLLLHNLADGSRAHRVSTFADGKSQALLHRHRRDQLNHQAHVVSRHHHF